MSGIEQLRKHLAELCEQTGLTGAVHDAEGRLYVLLNKVPLPAGVFNLVATDVLFIADHQYPMSAMDMFWVEPELLRADGQIPAGAESIESYLNARTWRRFSWHRQGVWRLVGNPLLDHFVLMEDRFAVEPRVENAA